MIHLAVDPSIQKKADDIRLKKKGREVRESLASGLEEMSEVVVDNTDRQEYVEEQFQNVIDETTGKDVISAPELIAARNGEANLKARLDKEQQEVTAQLAQTDADLNTRMINLKSFGARGDGTTDDTDIIQEAFDLVFQQGGGTLFFPIGQYKTTRPIIIKTTAETGGYTYAPIIIKGQGNRDSQIVKSGTETHFDLDATLIAVNGKTLDLSDSVSAIRFENISIRNESNAAKTYGYYMEKGSRITSDYSNFATIKNLADLENHDRYGFYAASIWSSTLCDSTYVGDYGLYIEGESTSLLLENLFSNSDKIGFRLSGTYSTINNCFGDFGNGILFDFYHATYDISSIGGESKNCHTMLRAVSSTLNIGTAFFIQSIEEEGTVFWIGGSTLNVDHLVIHNGEGVNRGYLWKGGSEANLIINDLKLAGSRFKYSNIDKVASNKLNIQVFERNNNMARGIKKNQDYSSGYWDWYLENPQHPINTIVFGLKDPTTNSKGEDVGWDNGGQKNDVYINQSFNEKNVLGWVRHDQNSKALRSGLNWYIPLILSGGTSARPVWKTIGMQFFDTALNKPIWWSGTNWVDANGVTV